MWNYPLSTISHLYAKGLAFNGVKGIRRKMDYAEAFKKLNELNEK